MWSLSVVVLLVTKAVATDDGAAWNFVMGSTDPLGPDNWEDNWAECAGDSQSPIDIITDDTTYLADQSLTFELNIVGEAHLSQNGHTVQITPQNTSILITTDNDGESSRKWNFIQAHFHWGDTVHTGSEHRVNGIQYPAEMHFVHTSPDNSDLMVVGVSFEVGDANPEVQELIDLFSQFQWNDTSVAVPVDTSTFDLAAILPHNPETEYFKYQGSLTTPPCSETVSWRKLKTVQTLSEAQLTAFRSFPTDSNQDGIQDTLTASWRPIQELNGRTVYRTYNPDTVPTGTGSTVDAAADSATTTADPVVPDVELRELKFGEGYKTGWTIFGVYAAILIVAFGIILPPRLKKAAAERVEEAEIKRKRNENYEKQRADAEKAMNEKKLKSKN